MMSELCYIIGYPNRLIKNPKLIKRVKAPESDA